jgi:hypothetical protein
MESWVNKEYFNSRLSGRPLIQECAGTFQPANNSIIMETATREHLGTASALIATQRQVGIAVGMAWTGTLFSAWRDGYQEGLVKLGTDGTSASRTAIPLAFHDVLLVSILVNVVVVVLSLLPLWSRGKTPPQVD